MWNSFARHVPLCAAALASGGLGLSCVVEAAAAKNDKPVPLVMTVRRAGARALPLQRSGPAARRALRSFLATLTVPLRALPPPLQQGEIGDESTTLRLLTAPAPHYEQFRSGKVQKDELVMHSGRNLYAYVNEAEVVFEVECDNAKFESFDDMVRAFKEQAESVRAGREIKSAAFSTSGPVDDYTQSVVYDRSTAFSASRQAWGGVSGAAIAAAMKMHPSKVAIVNDIAAAGLGTLTLHEDETFVLQDGQVRPHGPIALLYADEGLGEAFLTWAGTKYVANASEGGHAEFSPKTALEVELLGHMKKRLAKRCVCVHLSVSFVAARATGLFTPCWRCDGGGLALSCARVFSRSLALLLSLFLTHTLSLSHTHAHTHSLSLSPSFHRASATRRRRSAATAFRLSA